MKVRYRRMQPRDVWACVEHLAAHPILGPRYGSDIKHFPSALFAVLGHDSLLAQVFEEVQGSTSRLLNSGDASDLLHFLSTLVLFPPDDTASTVDARNRSDPNFPQSGHGSIKLTVLFNNPSDKE